MAGADPENLKRGILDYNMPIFAQTVHKINIIFVQKGVPTPTPKNPGLTNWI